MSLRMGRQLRTAHRLAFNVALLSISIWPASLAFFALTSIDPRQPIYSSLASFIGPLYVFSACVFATNSALLAIALAIERGVNPFLIWRQQFSWVSTSYFASASIAALLVVYGPSIDAALIAVLTPLLLVSYLVFKTTVGRLDDANKHLAEVNTLYLSTIETLAMAIDAKDQVTHGHIRRVQRFAVGLARRLGVDDERQLRAIEAAALLHDMGKLAIPEFILNKPGRLTPGEFDVMKTHAALGADILSAIQFPYPVVPIVRHHHENWDGTGYPDGISGVAIPIGARILSVVDCYDALTSDRPYRPAMTDERAIAILVERRGTMYDPLVVDTFIREQQNLRTEVAQAVVSTSGPPTQAPPLLVAAQAAVPDDRGELFCTLELLTTLTPLIDSRDLDLTGRRVTSQLRQVIGFDTAAIYVVDPSSLSLRCKFADGSLTARLLGLSIPMAEQLTGWVAAHRTSVWNSDSALDLTNSVETSISLASSFPLCDEGTVRGVLTLYADRSDEVTLSQRRAIELVLPALGSGLASAMTQRGRGADCREPALQDVALSLLDALLSHDRLSQDASARVAILAISVAAIRSDIRAGGPDHVEHSISELVAALQCQDEHSITIRLTDAVLLVCVQGSQWRASVESAVQSAMSSKALQTASCTHLWIDAPQLLQDFARRALASGRLPHGTRPSVH
ncbi:MAG: HD domain-containing phosphohydrolase [Vicinamibacterales bacterium]